MLRQIKLTVISFLINIYLNAIQPILLFFYKLQKKVFELLHRYENIKRDIELLRKDVNDLKRLCVVIINKNNMKNNNEITIS